MKTWEIIVLVICCACVLTLFSLYIYNGLKLSIRSKENTKENDKEEAEKPKENDLLARYQQIRFHEEIKKLRCEHKRLHHEINCIKDPQYDRKKVICSFLKDILGDTIQVLTPHNINDRLQYLKRKIEEYENELNPQPTTPEDPKPEKDFVKTTIKTVIDERFEKSFNDCMDALHKFGEAVKSACDKVSDETPTEQTTKTPEEKEV